jgi:hypothetical protein
MTERHKVESDKHPGFTFWGSLMASVSSKKNGSRRWSELRLYSTKGGQYIAQTIGGSSIEGERDYKHARCFHSIEEAKGFFGAGPLALELYRMANIEDYTLEVA